MNLKSFTGKEALTGIPIGYQDDNVNRTVVNIVLR